MKVVRFIGSVRRACVGRRIFVSRDGLVGLAPREATPGDRIVSSAGKELFLVLRETETVGYILVGTWYVSGSGDLPFSYSEVLTAHCATWWIADTFRA